MSTQLYNITFTPTSGSLGTLIEYKQSTSSVWITPTSAANPTTLDYFYLSLTTGVTYNIRLSSVGTNCTKQYRLLNVTPASGACCPGGYTLSPDSSYCYQIIEVAATPPTGSPLNAIAAHYVSYSTCGSYIYDVGWNINGTGTSTQINTAIPFWVNGGGICVDNTNVDGPLNRAGVWASATSDNQDIGFSVCVNFDTSKTYYIGMAADNYAILKLDAITLIQQDPTALDAQYSLISGASAFKVWHIYPVTITAGPHIIQLIGHNVASVASFGAEIYENTSGEIAAATGYGDLNLVFSTKDYVGQPIQLGTGGVGYTCPAGYALTCDHKCRLTLTTSTTTC